jgi:ArsR family transcriptional regulator
LDDGSSSPYVATILGNLKHWLEDMPEITEMVKRLLTYEGRTFAGHNTHDLVDES